MRTLEPTDLAFFDRARLRAVASTRLSAPPERVFASLAEPSDWPRWFPLLRSARWVSGAPGGFGAEREVVVAAFGRFHERFIAWEPGRRFAFTMIGTTSPLVVQMAEDYQLSPDGSGTRLDWVMAAAPTTIGAVLGTPTRLVMEGVFARGGRRLERLLAGA